MNSDGGSGLTLAVVLTVVFTILKLTHTISWSWWWVTSPAWITAALIAMILSAVVVVASLSRLW